jgi:chromate reductase
MYPINYPEVIVSFAKEKIDKDGKLTDEKTREKIRELLESLIAWTIKLKG